MLEIEDVVVLPGAKSKVKVDHGMSMTASYNGYVDTIADSGEKAEFKAKGKLTGPNGALFD